MTRRYVHGDQVDEPLVQYNDANIGTTSRRYLHADHQGSIIAHSSGTGVMLNTLSYDNYSIPKVTNIDRFGYTGQIWLKEIGLFHYKARMYHPTKDQLQDEIHLVSCLLQNFHHDLDLPPMSYIRPRRSMCRIQKFCDSNLDRGSSGVEPLLPQFFIKRASFEAFFALP